jgi:8-amino-7-oxononanoate synthase
MMWDSHKPLAKDYFQQTLDDLDKNSLRRRLLALDSATDSKVSINNRQYFNLASNNCLGLANHPELKRAAVSALREFGLGSGASRLLSGTCRLHPQLESTVADYHLADRALIFNSGYTANLGILSALAPAFSRILCDRLNHASILDGILLGKKPFTRYRHLDLNHLEHLLKKQGTPQKTLVVSETLFSMEGDFLALADILALQDKFGFFLYLDEAHSLGAYPEITKILESRGYGHTLLMGTFGKALGGFGAFVAGEKKTIEYLINKCRSFIFTTALPASVIAANLAAFGVLQRETWRVDALHQNSRRLGRSLKEAGFNIGNSASHIIPVILGDNKKALSVSRQLMETGIFAPAIRPPTVPPNSARLRLSLNSAFSEGDLHALHRALIRIAGP